MTLFLFNCSTSETNELPELPEPPELDEPPPLPLAEPDELDEPDEPPPLDVSLELLDGVDVAGGLRVVDVSVVVAGCGSVAGDGGSCSSLCCAS